MSIDEYISRLRTENNIIISVADNNIKVRGDKAALTQEIMASIRSRKPEILDFFSSVLPGAQPAPVPVTAGAGPYQLSAVQKRLYFLHETDRTSLAYNMPQGVRIAGALDVQKLEDSFRQLIDRHEALRTQFETVNGEIVQNVVAAPVFAVERYQLAGGDMGTMVQGFIRPFDLRQAPLIRVGLFESDEEKILIVDIHHIVSDGVSNNVLMQEFLSLYNNQPLPGVKLQYKDYAEWQQHRMADAQAQQQRAFWRNRFSPAPAAIDLPYNFSRPLHKTYKGGAVVSLLNEQQSARLRKVAREEQTTLFMLLLAAYNILLSKLTNQEDIVVGTPTSGRFYEDVEKTVGPFVNTIALRNYPRADRSFREFLQEIKSATIEAFDHQDWDYEMLVRDLQIDRSSGRNPLFDVFMAVQNFEQQEFALPGMKLSRLATTKAIAKFDLSLLVTEHPSGFTFEWEYAADLFERRTIDRWAGYFQQIINGITGNVDIRLADIDMVPPEEHNKVLHVFNDTAAAYPVKTIPAMFDEQAGRTPDNIALRYRHGSMTYRQLQEQVDKTARYLREVKGLRNGMLAGVMMDRHEWLIPTIFGILKAGGVYVPLDPAHPAQRIKTVIKDARIPLVIARGPSAAMQDSDDYQLVDLDKEAAAILSQPAGFVHSALSPHDLAYVIFTSGSTGKPKGVMIEHHSVVNRLCWMQKAYPLQEGSVLLQKTPLIFDVSVWELFWWAFTGASLCLLEPGAEKEPEKIADTIAAYGVTTIHFVPSMLGAFLPAPDARFDFSRLRTLKQVFSSGEELKAEQVAMFRDTLFRHCGSTLINLYGPTEATVDVTHHACTMAEASKPVPIGKPIDNTRLYILDAAGRPVPIGVAGELHLAGVGLARGYLDNPELTASKFIAHPAIKGERLYKTGDLARWTPDGDVEFLCRADNQVKVRGIRIEPGEIENQLLLSGMLKEAAVVAKERGDDKILVAYYTAATPVSDGPLRDFLKGQLPAYMIPAAFVQLECMPLTSSGKLDRKALPDPAFLPSDDFVPPANAMEEKMIAAWADVLRLDKNNIGVQDNFFAIGGHSIMGHRLINAINSTFSSVVTLRDIFEYPTVRDLTSLIASQHKNLLPAFVKAAEAPFYPASAAQRRLYYEQVRDSGHLGYNINSAYRLEGKADPDRLQKTFEQLIQRHEALRTRLFIVEDMVVQQVEETVPFMISTLDAGKYADVPAALADFVRPHDLSAPPLLRVGLLQDENLGDILLVDIHHIVCDGISLNILMNEFKSLYKGEELKALPYRYIDYAVWQQADAGAYAAQGAFWKQQLSGELRAPDLPVRTDRDKVSVYTAASVELDIEPALYARIREFAATANVSEFMFLLSVYYILLSRVSGNTDIIVGSDTIGRNRPEFRDIVGTFVNELPLRVQVERTLPYDTFLAAVKKCVLHAFDNQDFQFDDMLLLMHRDKQEKLVHVHFSYANFLDNEVTPDAPQFTTIDTRKERKLTQYELKAEVYPDRGAGLRIAFVYSRELYEDATVQLFTRYYRNILVNVLHHPHSRLLDINMKKS
nr:non-ribosomal peptide synthetase [uncultured Chitinophaga sp.]